MLVNRILIITGFGLIALGVLPVQYLAYGGAPAPTVAYTQTAQMLDSAETGLVPLRLGYSPN